MPRPGVEGQILPDRWVNAAAPRECVVEALAPRFDHPSWILKLQFLASELCQVEVNLQNSKAYQLSYVTTPVTRFIPKQEDYMGLRLLYIDAQTYVYK